MGKSKEQKQHEAKSRQEHYENLSVDHKIKRAKRRRGDSSKEIARLKEANHG